MSRLITAIPKPIQQRSSINYLIDIDGTITDDVANEDFRVMPDLVPYDDAVEAINILYAQGNTITFFTSRTSDMREMTEEWLKKWEFNYHGLIMNKPRGGNYYWIDNHWVGSHQFDGSFWSATIALRNIERLRESQEDKKKEEGLLDKLCNFLTFLKESCF